MKLVFGRVPVENMFALVRRSQPLVNYLEDHLGVVGALCLVRRDYQASEKLAWLTARIDRAW